MFDLPFTLLSVKEKEKEENSAERLDGCELFIEETRLQTAILILKNCIAAECAKLFPDNRKERNKAVI